MTPDERIRMLYYAAGYFDGEGCITTSIRVTAKKECQVHVRIKVVSGDHDSLAVFVSLFGGKVATERKREGFKQMYRWGISGRNCFPVLQELTPLLRSDKRARANKWLGVQYFGSTYEVIIEGE